MIKNQEGTGNDRGLEFMSENQEHIERPNATKLKRYNQHDQCHLRPDEPTWAGSQQQPLLALTQC